MKRVITAMLLMLVLVSAAAASGPSLGIREFSSTDDLASAITAYFPKVQGAITAVNGAHVSVALGSKNGIQQGAVLSVWRDGKEIHHPVTSAVIGRVEDEVGSVELSVVSEGTSTGIMKKKIMEPRVGDTVRITPKKMSLAIIPLRTDRSDIITKLAGRLKDGGRFDVLDMEIVSQFLADKKQRDSSLVNELSRTHNVDIVVTVEVLPSEGKYLVTSGIYYADDMKPFGTVVALLDLRTKRDALGEVKPFFAPVMEEKGSLQDLPFDAQFFTAADLEGDGTLRYVFSDGARIHIFKEGPAGWREDWTETIAYSGSEMQHINLDAADINGNGRVELFVTGMLNKKVVSYVIEFTDGLYKRTVELPGFLRVVSLPRSGIRLIGQDYDPRTLFGGPVKQYVWADGKYSAGTEFPLPKGLGLYGFVLADLGDAQAMLVALNDKEQLLVYSRDVLVWKSEERYPAVGITVIKPLTGIDEMFTPSITEVDKARKVKISGRVLALDLDNDGKEEVLLPRNLGETFLSGFKEAEFISLTWTGSRLEQRRSIKDIPGSVIDYQVVRKGLGAKILALVMIPGGPFKSDQYRVMTVSMQ